jgi:hypothetical protein
MASFQCPVLETQFKLFETQAEAQLKLENSPEIIDFQ